MKKVLLTVMSFAVLTLALALPAVAAVPSGNNCTPVFPIKSGNCPAALPVKNIVGADQCPQLDFNKILQMCQNNLSDCFKAISADPNCSTTNCN